MVRSKPPRAGMAVCLALIACLLTAGQLPAQGFDEGAARVITAEGQVSVLRGAEPWALFADQTVRVGETIVSGDDGFAELQVSDGSQFFVFPNSHVVFRKNPGSLRDLLDIFLGRVKIHIQRLGGRPNHNRIFTPTAVISVRGTTFDVQVDENETTLLLVDEGLVSVVHRLLPSGREIPVAEGESLVVYRDTPLAKAGVDKVKAAQLADNVARTLAYIWNRIGRTGGGGGPAGPGAPTGGGAPLPGDTEAPEPPPPSR